MLSNRTDTDPGDGDGEELRQMVAINEDVMTDILSRLPVKSLLRFQSVAKKWQVLISNPHFHRVHFRRNPVSWLLFPRDSYRSYGNTVDYNFVSLNGFATEIPFRSLNFIENAIHMKIEHSCNGLFCCSCYRENENCRTYYIYNPATKKHSTLPQPGGVDVRSISLAFDPCKSPHYKVVCVRRPISSFNRLEIEIYSSVTGSWRLYGEISKCPSEMIFNRAVYWNCGIHWICKKGLNMYFNMEREILGNLQPTPLPEGVDEGEVAYFGESQGHLHLIEHYGICLAEFNIFEMERDYSGWFVKYRVNLDVVRPKNSLDWSFGILCLIRREDGEGASLVLNVPGEVISYDLLDKTFKWLCDSYPCPNSGLTVKYISSSSHRYFETLSWV